MANRETFDEFERRLHCAQYSTDAIIRMAFDAKAELAAARKLVESAYREGFDHGHNSGISCAHDLSPRCRCESADEWKASDAHDELDEIDSV